MKNKPSYAQGGKLTEKEARLLRALMGKLVGEEGMRVMQASGKTPSLFQRFVDEASQVASGISEAMKGGDPYILEDIIRGYQQAESEDRARDASGASGKVDATLSGIAGFLGDLFDDTKSQQSLITGQTRNPAEGFSRAFDEARMTDAEREARRDEALKTGKARTPSQIEKMRGTSDLLKLLEANKVMVPGKGDQQMLSEARAEERRRGFNPGELYSR